MNKGVFGSFNTKKEYYYAFFHVMAIFIKYLLISASFVSLYSLRISFIYIKFYLNRFILFIIKIIDFKLNNRYKLLRY